MTSIPLRSRSTKTILRSGDVENKYFNVRTEFHAVVHASKGGVVLPGLHWFADAVAARTNDKGNREACVASVLPFQPICAS
jgi:hypothetical protein